MNNCQSFLYTFDLIGINPQILIFNNNRYKSKLSTLISILILFFSISFAIFSLIEYLKYENPIISYTKNNDETTKRNILFKDFLLMFQLIDTINSLKFNTINSSIGYYQPYYLKVYNNGTIINTTLNIENCQLGKTVNLNYKDLIDDKSFYGRKVEEFYCISNEHENLSLFYDPNIGFSIIKLNIIIKNNSNYSPENLQNLIIGENSIIDHYNKKSPISKSYLYQFTQGFSSLEYTSINYYFQYIKYESDEGLIYKDSKELNTMSFHDMRFYRNKQDNYNLTKNFENSHNSIIGEIEIGINKSNFDNYKRTYQRLQSLLAEIMSVVNLLFGIGRQISNFFCGKKMNCDIVDHLLNNNKNHVSIQQNYIRKNKQRDDKKEKSSERKIIIKSELMDKSNNTYNLEKEEGNNLSKSKENNRVYKIEKVHNINTQNKIIKELNYFHIIKSFLCFKDERTKLINLCHKIINEDISIERILERLYNLENIYYVVSNKENINSNVIKNERFKEINEYIHKINNEIKKESNFKDEKNNNFQKYQRNTKEKENIK